VKYGFEMASATMFHDQIYIVGEGGNHRNIHNWDCHCVDFMVGKELSLVTPSYSANNDDFSHL